jgi:cellulose synthase/poly-beta-1,6-N-acetylglucosamine synthase-like glycosyltransferase
VRDGQADLDPTTPILRALPRGRTALDAGRRPEGDTVIPGRLAHLDPTIPIPKGLLAELQLRYAALHDREAAPPDRTALDERTRHTGSGFASTRRCVLWVALIVISLAAMSWVWYELRPQPVQVLMLSVASFNIAVGVAEARWRLHAWRTPEANEHIGWPEPVSPESSAMSFSLLVAARDEATVIAATLRGLAQQKHPRREIIVSLCDDDTATIAAASTVAGEYPDLIKIVTGSYERSSKAHQLNAALSECNGDVVGVFDAEDDVADSLLLHVEALFIQSGADVVQGGVQLMNLGDRFQRWFQVHNVLEYYFWFTSRMAYQADVGFVPLGGNTVFIYRSLLEESRGWPISLTEDCSLGVLLATKFGARVATAYSAELSTREEAPPTIFNKRLGSLFWQRDRWVRGFLKELIDGAWLKMPTLRQKALAGYILATPILQGASAVLLPIALITAVLVKAPIGIAMLMFAPLIPVGITIVTQLLGLREFARTYKVKASIWHYASILFFTQLYQLILMSAALVAAYKAARGDMTWYKTGRASQHREPAGDLTCVEGMASLPSST